MMYYCQGCPLKNTCTRQFDEERRALCPMLEEENDPIRYHNPEGYADPTAFFALRNTVRKKGRTKRYSHGAEEKMRNRRDHNE